MNGAHASHLVGCELVSQVSALAQRNGSDPNIWGRFVHVWRRKQRLRSEGGVVGSHEKGESAKTHFPPRDSFPSQPLQLQFLKESASPYCAGSISRLSVIYLS